MRTILFMAALSVAAIAGCTKSDADHGATADQAAKSDKPAKPEEKLQAMTVDEVDQGLTAKTLVAVDCNGDRTRKQEGVLPGAVLVSDEESFAANELPPDKTTRLVFYCHNEA
jgi:hypothetical protein